MASPLVVCSRDHRCPGGRRLQHHTDHAGVAKIDATTNTTVPFTKLDVPEELDQEASIGSGEGGVWLVVNGPDCVQCLVAHLDRDLELQAKIPVTAGAAAVEVRLGGVWVSSPDNDLVEQIDPTTKKVVGQVRTGSRPLSRDRRRLGLVAESRRWNPHPLHPGHPGDRDHRGRPARSRWRAHVRRDAIWAHGGGDRCCCGSTPPPTR